MPTLYARFDGDEHNSCVGQSAMDGFGKEAEVSKDGCRVFSVGNVVVAGVEEDRFRLVRNDNAVGEKDAVDNVRASESAVDDRRVGKIGGQRFPPANARAPNKKNAAKSDGMNAVLRFKGLNGRFPFCVCGMDGCGGAAKQKAWKQPGTAWREGSSSAGSVGLYFGGHHCAAGSASADGGWNQSFLSQSASRWIWRSLRMPSAPKEGIRSFFSP